MGVSTRGRCLPRGCASCLERVCLGWGAPAQWVSAWEGLSAHPQYGQLAGSTHPTGMHACLSFKFAHQGFWALLAQENSSSNINCQNLVLLI